MKKISILAILLLLIACKETGTLSQSNLVDPSDYNTYLNNLKTYDYSEDQPLIDSLTTVVTANPGYIVDGARLAAMYDNRYNVSGDVEALVRSVRFRESVSQNTALQPENNYRLQVQAYIKTHQFKKADSLMDSFTNTYASPESMMVQYDVSMETGDYAKAKRNLDAIRNTNDYNYLIRAAKWNDYAGNLDSTIELLEKATAIAIKSGTESQVLWAYTNLADYYGHHGDIKKSYEHYLKALDLDPANHYCLKGIAWIAYSHDDNTDEAIRILKKLKESHKIPDYDLLLAEMYTHKGQSENAAMHLNAFKTETDKPAYGAMYNLYKIENGVEGTAVEKVAALKLAQRELANRSTPEVYGYLAQAQLANGMVKEALNTIEKHVVNKTFEPVAALQMVQIYKATGNQQMLKKLKTELMGTSYEMGPVAYLKINAL